MREKYPNAEFCLVRIFLYSDWILKNMDQKELRIWTLFMQQIVHHGISPKLSKSCWILGITFPLRMSWYNFVLFNILVCVLLGLEFQLLRRKFFNVSNQCKCFQSVSYCRAIFEAVKLFELGKYIDMKAISSPNAWEFILSYEST